MWRIQTVLELLINTIFSPRPKTKKIMMTAQDGIFSFLPNQQKPTATVTYALASRGSQNNENPIAFRSKIIRKSNTLSGRKKKLIPGCRSQNNSGPFRLVGGSGYLGFSRSPLTWRADGRREPSDEDGVPGLEPKKRFLLGPRNGADRRSDKTCQ